MPRARSAFTLVEILIVVVVLGILAAIVIPYYSDVTTVARETNLRENLSKIRVHIEVYRNQHTGLPTADHFSAQLTKCTNYAGEVSDAPDTEYRFGPYIEQMPPNPISGLGTVRGAGAPNQCVPPGDIDGGWWYNETTGAFYADLTAARVDSQGMPYNTY